MKLLITGATTWNEVQKKDLVNMGHELIYVQDERIPLIEQEIDVSDIDAVICNGLFLHNNIAEFKKLKYIQLTSAGFDRVPMDYITEHGIEIYNARGVYSIPMAEFAVSGVLQIYKKSQDFYENQKKHLWKKNRNIQELYGKKVCIVGCGNVGTECAKRFKTFGCQITGVDLYPRENFNYDSIISLDKLERALEMSDVIILTLPLTKETKYLLNGFRLSLIKTGAVLVNISRGAIVDTKALINELPRLGGAVLDVFETEPLSTDDPLWEFNNVILTPHNSFEGGKNRERLQNVIIENLHKRSVKK